jgi:hypothetical protein
MIEPDRVEKLVADVEEAERRREETSHEITIPGSEGSPNPSCGEEEQLLTVKARVVEYLDAHPEDARSPTKVAAALHVNGSSAKRECMAWRNRRRKITFTPTLIQRLHFVGRTNPETVPKGSPPVFPGLTWEDRGDGKLTGTMPLPHVDGHAELRLSKSGDTAELILASTYGFTISEVVLLMTIFTSIFDGSTGGTLSYEAFRDGRNARFEGVESRTYQDGSGLMLKMYNHEDARGTLARVETRPPAVKITYKEIAAFFDGKQPLGRDEKIESLKSMVEDNSRGLVMLNREIMHMRKALDKLRGSSE